MLSATTLLRDLAAGRITIDAVYDRVEAAVAEREGVVRAFAHLDLPAARRVAADLAGTALKGLPFGVKDVIDTADMPTAYGSPIYAGWRPRADAAAVVMARRAGAAVVGKTRTTEFANLNPTVTTNPLNAGHTPGGSSSGSAAAVAAGFVAAAFGTQTAGSTIRPASFCGVAAVKPSFGILPTVGLKSFSWHLDTIGLFAATVEDCATVLAAVTGRDLRGDTGRPPRFGLVRTHLWSEASEAMQGAVEGAAAAAAAAGAPVREIALPDLFVDALAAQHTIMDFEGALALAYEHETHRDLLSDKLLEGLDRGAAIGPAAYDAARSVANAARRGAHALFEEVDVLLTPSAPGAAPAGLSSTGDARFNRLWTLLGVPAVNVPGATDAAGLPLGVQLVAPFGRDGLALAAGAWLEGRIARGELARA